MRWPGASKGKRMYPSLSRVFWARGFRLFRVLGFQGFRVPGFRVLGSWPTRHILPPSEIDLGLCLAVFAGSGGKYLFHRIGWKGRIWQLWLVLTAVHNNNNNTIIIVLTAVHNNNDNNNNNNTIIMIVLTIVHWPGGVRGRALTYTTDMYTPPPMHVYSV